MSINWPYSAEFVVCRNARQILFTTHNSTGVTQANMYQAVCKENY
jgi:hypothetical protein